MRSCCPIIEWHTASSDSVIPTPCTAMYKGFEDLTPGCHDWAYAVYLMDNLMKERFIGFWDGDKTKPRE